MTALKEHYEQFLIKNPDSKLTFGEWESSLDNDWKDWEDFSNELTNDDEDITGWEKLDTDNWDNFLSEPKKDFFL